MGEDSSSAGREASRSVPVTVVVPSFRVTIWASVMPKTLVFEIVVGVPVQLAKKLVLDEARSLIAVLFVSVALLLAQSEPSAP